MKYSSTTIASAFETLSTSQSSDKTINISFVYPVNSSATLSVELYPSIGSFTYSASGGQTYSYLRAVRIA